MNSTRNFLGIGVGLVVSAALSAETAYTTKSINLRAGPSRDYELVTQAPAGAPVEVYGCVDDWTWCDVSLGDDRGWVYAGNLEYPYQNRRVVILNNGPIIGFPIVTFSVGPYWDTYYRGRPWYSRESYWSHRPPPVHWIGPARPSYVRPSRPSYVRPSGPRPSRPVVVRPPVERPRAQPQPERQRVVRPEAARPQPPRPAPVRAPDNKSRDNKSRPPREERKPGGN